MKLLTHDQLVDWLIYHCPLWENWEPNKPFIIGYEGQMWRSGFVLTGDDPLVMYSKLASDIINSSTRIHMEITELYWYWTI